MSFKNILCFSASGNFFPPFVLICFLFFLSLFSFSFSFSFETSFYLENNKDIQNESKDFIFFFPFFFGINSNEIFRFLVDFVGANQEKLFGIDITSDSSFSDISFSLFFFVFSQTLFTPLWIISINYLEDIQN